MFKQISYKDCLTAILNQKNLIGGIAIISVILYHTDCLLFYVGFIGVDFFFFFSGYSLAYSMKEHSVSEFYLRRVKRVLPMFLYLTTLISIINLLRGQSMTVYDWICNLSSLSYYKIGGQFTDWYLCSLFAFYLFYPLFFRFSSIKGFPVVCYMAFTIVMLLFAVYDIDWIYECAIGRLPIFLLGLICYRELNNSMRKVWHIIQYTMVLSIIYFCVYITHKSYLPTFGLIYLLVPMVLVLMGGVFQNYAKKYQFHKMHNAIEYCGVHSLEIYVSNVLCMKCMGFITEDNSILLLSLYFLGTWLISYVTIKIQYSFNKVIS